MSSLSSGSDCDDAFYDAIDVTPLRNPSAGGETVSERSFDVDSLNIEEDDDLLAQKRNSLERMRKMEEDEQRRKKLEMMRSMMSDDLASPTSPTPTADGAQQAPNLEENTALKDQAGNSPSTSKHPNQSPSSQADLSPDSNIPLETSLQSIPAKSAPFEDIDKNLNKPDSDQDKLHKKEMPASEYSPEVEIPTVFIGEDQKPEPDIVQSAKAATLRPAKVPPPRPPPPVAPPRRKRKNKPDDLPEASADESGDNLSPGGGGVGLPTHGLPTPTSTAYNLTRDLEQSLDLQSATAGSRVVTAKYDELSSKAEWTEEEKKTAELQIQQKEKLMAKKDNQSKQGASGGPAGSAPGDASSTSAGAGTCILREKTDSAGLPVSEQRPRSNSGSRFLTDKEILEMVTVLNLDTGETVPLSQAEDRLPRCVNPLSLHIMRRTKEYSSDSSLHKLGGSDDEKGGSSTTKTISSVKPVSRRTVKLKRFLGKTVHKIKSVADEVLHDKDSNAMSDDEDETLDGRRMIRIKASSSNKGPYDFDLLVPVQDLRGEQSGAVWTMKFSPCGRLLATGGQDNLLRVWVLKDSAAYFDDMRQKYSEATKVSPTPSQDSLSSQTSEQSLHAEAGVEDPEDKHAPFMRRPFMVYKGHTADLLDLSWSKNYFILSSSMDKTVRLWHVSRKECLCCFQHIDFVTAIAFLPRDDRYFLSGSLDGKLRLWNIPDKKVALWNEVIGQSKLITAANFCLNGRFAVVGTYDGRCVFYSTDQLKYYTQIHVRSTRGKNARGRKVTGIEPVPGEDKILVTSNDSRVRLYDLRDLTLTSKYKGCVNNSSQIKASFSSNGKYIISGSEDHYVYIWRTQHDFYKYTSARRDRNDFWEGIKAHQAVVTAAVFAPQPGLIIKSQFQYEDNDEQTGPPEVRGEVIVSADFNGAIKVFINKFKPGAGM